MTAFHTPSAGVEQIRMPINPDTDRAPVELTEQEIDQVQGGFGPAGAITGAVIGGGVALLTGKNAGQVASAAIFGLVGGFFGGVGMHGTRVAVGLLGGYAVARSARPDRSDQYSYVKH